MKGLAEYINESKQSILDFLNKHGDKTLYDGAIKGNLKLNKITFVIPPFFESYESSFKTFALMICEHNFNNIDQKIYSDCKKKSFINKLFGKSFEFAVAQRKLKENEYSGKKFLDDNLDDEIIPTNKILYNELGALLSVILSSKVISFEKDLNNDLNFDSDKFNFKAYIDADPDSGYIDIAIFIANFEEQDIYGLYLQFDC